MKKILCIALGATVLMPVAAVAFTSDEIAAVEEASLALEAASTEETPQAQPSATPAATAPGTAWVKPFEAKVYGASDRRMMVPLDVIIPISKVGPIEMGTSDTKTFSVGVMGISGGAQFLTWLRKDTDGIAMQILKGLGFSVDVEWHKGTGAFTEYLYNYEKYSTRTLSSDSYGYDYRGCDYTYYCGNQVCCDYHYTVNVYGTPDGHYVAWQKNSVGFRFWVPVAEIKKRLLITAGVGPRLHELAYANNSDYADKTNWKTSWNWSTEASLRIRGPLEAGGGYERSFKGYQNQIVKAFVRVDLNRVFHR
jgi:hypothetical protein